MENLLEIKNLHVQYKTERATSHALNGLDLTIGKGESLGLVGETGAGKTTTALSILRLLPECAKTLSGEILFDGESILDMSEREIRKKRGNKIAMVFQNPLTALNPVFTVGEQIAMVLRVHRGMGRKEAMQYAGKLLEQVGIASYRVKDYPNQFSGGMRQRVGIAAAIACSPELLIADEPTTALDVTIQAQILDLMRQLQKDMGTAISFITHDLGVVYEMCERVLVLYCGEAVEEAPVEEIFANPMHPYTQGLLSTLPKFGVKGKLPTIPGTVPPSGKFPTGCVFAPRCPHATERCRSEKPQMRAASDGHLVRCHQIEEASHA